MTKNEFEQSLEVLTIPEVEILEKISMKLEPQDRKIIIIPDKLQIPV